MANVARCGGNLAGRVPRSNPRKRDQGLEFSGLFNPVRFAPHQCCGLLKKRASRVFPRTSTGFPCLLKWRTTLAAAQLQDSRRHVRDAEARSSRLCCCSRRRALLRRRFPQRPRIAQPPRRPPPAGAATDLATAKSYMISAANPLAVEAGLEMLRAGGSAADAAIAVQLVLNLVEPQSSGLGGGAFILHWDAAGRAARGLRRTRDRAGRRDRGPVPGRGPSAQVRRGRVRRPERRRAGDAAASWKPCTSGTAGCPGRGCSRPPSGSPRTAFASPRACTCCCAGRGRTASRRRRGAYFFDHDRQRPAGRLPAQEP